MKSSHFVLIILPLFFASCDGCDNGLKQDQETKEEIRTDAIDMANSLEERDYRKFMSFTPRIIIEGVGGEEAYLNYLNELYDEYEMKGIEIYKISFGEIGQMLKKNGETQAILSQELVLKSNDQLDTFHTPLIAVKRRTSKHWMFISVNNRSWEEMSKFYPYLHNDLRWEN